MCRLTREQLGHAILDLLGKLQTQVSPHRHVNPTTVLDHADGRHVTSLAVHALAAFQGP